ncbi:hypothetical protein [Flaviaesturariibacter amylovorans]|uniref:General stress protein n=1 Tax=Flaviaesturariibacter amylovorans TaxID=1084520 RepID=A0ABP8GY72_9BACT
MALPDEKKHFESAGTGRRLTDEEATQAAREPGTGDPGGQGAHPGLTDSPSGDGWAENKIATSLDDE